MHIALLGASSKPVAAVAEASPRRLLGGQYALIAIIAGATWLAVVGGFLSSYILSEGSAGASHHPSLPSYAAYNQQELVPTSFGAVSVYRADLTQRDNLVEVHVSMRVDNNQRLTRWRNSRARFLENVLWSKLGSSRSMSRNQRNSK